MGVSRGSHGDGTVGELAPSFLNVLQKKQLLMLAGDIETNPGPSVYGKCVFCVYSINSGYYLPLYM